MEFKEFNEGGEPSQQNHQPQNTDNDRVMALLAWVLQFVAPLLAPIIILVINDKKSAFVDHHSKQSLNVAITAIIYSIVCGILMFVFIGFLLIFAVMIWELIVIIKGAISANNNEKYYPPLTIPFFKD